jgi:hypothetical protein
MLESRKAAVAIEEAELVELQRIIIDHDEKGAFEFLKEVIYKKVHSSQKGRLKSHLDTGGGNPVDRFRVGG